MDTCQITMAVSIALGGALFLFVLVPLWEKQIIRFECNLCGRHVETYARALSKSAVDHFCNEWYASDKAKEKMYGQKGGKAWWTTGR